MTTIHASATTSESAAERSTGDLLGVDYLLKIATVSTTVISLSRGGIWLMRECLFFFIVSLSFELEVEEKKEGLRLSCGYAYLGN